VLFTFLRQPGAFQRSWWERLKMKWQGKAKSVSRAG
jgi:hypothetical protein